MYIQPNTYLVINRKTSFCTKAELLLEVIFCALNFLPWEFLLVKNLEIEKQRPPSIKLLKPSFSPIVTPLQKYD